MQTSITTLSNWTGYDRRTIKKRLEGLPFQDEGTGGHFYDSTSALRRIYLGNPDEQSDLDPQAEKAKLDRARRHLAEIDLEIKRREVIPVDTVSEQWEKIGTAIRQKLLALPGRLVTVTYGAATQQEAEREAKKLIHETLAELASNGKPQ
jgi:hypothetical protein